MSLKLISFPLCPFVQRSVIALRTKQQAYDIEYVKLDDMPQWYLDKVPTGRVPSLWVDDEVLFESAAINEFINETTPGSLFPEDAVQRARARAWIAYGDELLMNQYRMIIAADQESYEKERDDLLAATLKLADAIKGPYFFGEQFSLADIAYAPLFVRMKLVAPVYAAFVEAAGEGSDLVAWANRLVEMEDVKNSVLPEFPTMFVNVFTGRGSYILSQG